MVAWTTPSSAIARFSQFFSVPIPTIWEYRGRLRLGRVRQLPEPRRRRWRGTSKRLRSAFGPIAQGLRPRPRGAARRRPRRCPLARRRRPDRRGRARIDPLQVSALLGLTPSEAKVSALLAEGRSVREIAAATGLKESYVRWLLKQVYRKLGLSGQVALVQRILAAYTLPGS
ncbi:MAG: helix-turn-helix transcriptional regulator [Chloroflexi bacterium]|nr:helix-turn-helix transcriptional regulator [Chloroflexota bacterium]